MLPMQPEGPNNADYIMQLTRKAEALAAELQMFKALFSYTAVFAMDEKGRVRIPVPDVRLTEKIENLEFNQTETKAGKAGPVRIQITFVEGTKIPASKKRPAKGKAKK